MKAKHHNSVEDIKLYSLIIKEINETLDLDKKEANHYFLFKLLVYGTLAFSTYTSLFIIENKYLFTLNFILYGFISVLLCFNFAHDFSHHAIFKRPFWDNLAFEFIYTLVGAHPQAWKGRHLHSHHFAPNVENHDTDLSITNLIRVLPTSKLLWYHKYQFIYAPVAYATYSLYWVFIKDFIVLFNSKNKNRNNKASYYFNFFMLKLIYIIYIFILPLLFSHQSAKTIIISFILMHFVQSVYTLFTFFITHHVYETEYPTADENGLINTSWFMNQIRSSNDFYPFSKLGNFIFGGVNNHIAHHLFPKISHYHYPKVNVILYKRLEEAGIKINVSTYFGGIKSHMRLLKKRGNSKD